MEMQRRADEKEEGVAVAVQFSLVKVIVWLSQRYLPSFTSPVPNFCKLVLKIKKKKPSVAGRTDAPTTSANSLKKRKPARRSVN